MIWAAIMPDSVALPFLSSSLPLLRSFFLLASIQLLRFLLSFFRHQQMSVHPFLVRRGCLLSCVCLDHCPLVAYKL